MGAKEELPLDGGDGTKYEDAESTPNTQCCEKLDQYATKNVLVISLCFLLLFTAFNGLQFLQSSLHTEAGLGLASISVLYSAFASATLLGLGPALISKIGHKWTMVAGMSAYFLWVMMNGHATWYTMVPAAILVGLGAGPLWVAKAAYLTVTATNVAKRSQENMEVITLRYFGVFFCSVSLSSLIGPAISSAVLHVSKDDGAAYNSSSDEALWSRCGARDCPGTLMNETAIEPQDPHKVWLLVGVYGGCAFLAVLLMALMLDNIPKPAESFTLKQLFKVASSVVRYHRGWRQILLIPLSLQQGWEVGFVFGEFTKSFGSCVYGVWMVGVVVLPFGVTQSTMSLVAGWLVKYTGRLLLMTVAQVTDLALMLTLLFWNGDGGQYVVFTLSCLLGITDAIKRTVLNGTLSLMFPKNSETAFCAYKFWESCAWIIPFAYSQYLCTSTKLWVLVVITVTAATCFIVMERPCTKESVYGTVKRDEAEADAKQKQDGSIL